MIMGMDPDVVELCMSDVNVDTVPPFGAAQDLAHSERKCSVKGYKTRVGKNPIDHLEECLTFCHLVHVPAGVPRSPAFPVSTCSPPTLVSPRAASKHVLSFA